MPTIQGMVEEGGTYKLENVMIGFNEGNYKLLPHKHKLNMELVWGLDQVSKESIFVCFICNDY